MERTAYDILGVSRTAPAEVMKAAKTALAKIYHPDNGSDPDAEAMTQVNEAYDILTDPERRYIHDSFHAAGGSDGAPAQRTAGSAHHRALRAAPLNSGGSGRPACPGS